MAKAVQRFDVKLYGLCFMSNHYHLLLSSKDAASLAQFIQYLNSNIACEKGATRIFIATRLAHCPIEVFSTSIGGLYASSITIPA